MIVVAAGMLASARAHAEDVIVTAIGRVTFNPISTPPLSMVAPGEQASMTLVVDSDNFVEGVPGDTRGYINEFQIGFSILHVVMYLLDPFPAGETP